MPAITLNGEARTLQATTLHGLLAEEAIPPEYLPALAVARNGRVIPRANWADTPIHAGDTIEIVKPFVGG